MLLLAVGCVTNDAQVNGVAFMRDKALIHDCYSLGDINTQVMTLHPNEAFAAETKQKGGDTLLITIPLSAAAYVCDPKKIIELRARDAARDAVRITNRQDVVSLCKSELDARAQTVSLGGDVFYILSDTSRTAEEKASGSSTTYNYEVRRLTGEVYRCAAKTP
jgi:hypothetical protein